MDDINIINSVLAGQKDQYALLMDKYYKEMFKLIYNLTNHYEDSEDLIQDIFLKVYHLLDRYRSDKASFRTWLYRIATNETLNYVRKKSYQTNRYTAVYDDDINASSTDVYEETIKDQQINQITTAMEKVLKPKHYQIMMLHYFSNLSVKEISEVLKIPIKTIYKAIESSVEKIKKEVQ